MENPSPIYPRVLEKHSRAVKMESNVTSQIIKSQEGKKTKCIGNLHFWQYEGNTNDSD